jgi:C_GCAxxG_C_C family probable redox protein
MDEATTLSAKQAAINGFRDLGPRHLNCAQAVVHFASSVLGLRPDSAVAARYLGGGMARTGQVCGALSGCAVSLGLRDLQAGLTWPDAESPDTARLQRLFRDFDETFGATACRDLVGYEIGTADGYRRFRTDGKYALCEQYVSWACDHLVDILYAAR